MTFTAAIPPMKLTLLRIYANTLHNRLKRKYANQYITWLHGGATGPEIEHPGLGYMAAQAVRLEVDRLNPYVERETR